MQEAELKRVFTLVNKGKGDTITKAEFELLLMAMGFNLSPGPIEGCLGEIFSFCPSLCSDDQISFPAFATWWMDKDSMYLYTKK